MQPLKHTIKTKNYVKLMQHLKENSKTKIHIVKEGVRKNEKSLQTVNLLNGAVGKSHKNYHKCTKRREKQQRQLKSYATNHKHTTTLSYKILLFIAFAISLTKGTAPICYKVCSFGLL